MVPICLNLEYPLTKSVLQCVLPPTLPRPLLRIPHHTPPTLTSQLRVLLPPRYSRCCIQHHFSKSLPKFNLSLLTLPFPSPPITTHMLPHPTLYSASCTPTIHLIATSRQFLFLNRFYASNSHPYLHPTSHPASAGPSHYTVLPRRNAQAEIPSFLNNFVFYETPS